MIGMKVTVAATTQNPVLGDLYLNSASNLEGSQSLTEEVTQLLYTRFRFFKSEWFLDASIGVPYYQSILGIKQAISVVAAILKNVVTTCPGVKSLNTFALVQGAARSTSATFSCTLLDGTILRSSDFAPFIVGEV